MSTVPITLDTFGWTGLVGTLGYTVYNADGSTHQARTAEGIIEGATGVYWANVDTTLVAGRVVVWDTDNGAPVYGTEAFASSLGSAGTAGATTALSLSNLAWQCWRRYKRGSPGLYVDFLKEAYDAFVEKAGGIYSRSMDVDIVAGQTDYPVPGDFRTLRPNGVWIINGSDERALTLQPLGESISDLYAVPGVPAYYSFIADRVIRLTPTPSTEGAGWTLRLYYDAMRPSTLTVTEALPIPSRYEDTLRAYAIKEMALVLDDNGQPDYPSYGVWKKRYEDGISEYWSRRQQTPQRSAQLMPWDA